LLDEATLSIAKLIGSYSATLTSHDDQIKPLRHWYLQHLLGVFTLGVLALIFPALPALPVQVDVNEGEVLAEQLPTANCRLERE